MIDGLGSGRIAEKREGEVGVGVGGAALIDCVQDDEGLKKWI